MNRRTVLVFHNGDPLVLISVPPIVVLSDVREWYAREYGFEAHKLTLMYLDTVRYPDAPSSLLGGLGEEKP